MHQWFDLSAFSGVPAASLYSDWAATPARSGPVSRGSSPVARVAAKRPVVYRRCPEPANICSLLTDQQTNVEHQVLVYQNLKSILL